MSTIRGIMRTVIGLLLVLMVSGDDVTDVEGFLGQSVILPCKCSNRNLQKEFKWQMGNKPALVKYNGTTPDFHANYTGRAQNSSNCSILLTNITEADQGMYRCIFKVEDQYSYSRVNLSISDPEKVIQIPPTDAENTRTLYRVMPFVLVILVLSLLLFHNWKVSRRETRGGNQQCLYEVR